MRVRNFATVATSNQPASTRLCVRVSALLLVLSSVALAESNAYVGSDVCAGCHKNIAATQAETKMAHTWQTVPTPQLPANYSATHSEGPEPAIQYAATQTGQNVQFRVQLPGQPALDFPVESIVGGERHALTFLFRVSELQGSPLPRAPLIEGRYIHSVLEKGLALELGFPEEKPASYETGLGRVLTPALEQRCFSCHTAPRTWGTKLEKGVACENCHGPGEAHLRAVTAHSKDLAILNPRKLPVPDQMRPCTQCHAGSGYLSDPLPENLLISDQVTSLKNSECWRQSGGQITCLNCHNPHQDASRAVLVERSEKTCFHCHSAAVSNRAALCPVNRTTGCVGCHLTKQIRGAFHLADHWIRVHDEQNVHAPKDTPAWRSTLTPRHLYLRAIVLTDRDKAEALRQQLLAGGSFFELARVNSVDSSSAIAGGFLGDLETSQLDPAWSAVSLKLQPGEIAPVVEAGGKAYIVQRLPRNFRLQADALVSDALELRKQGKVQESVAQLVEALKVYPYFLRALTYLGIHYAQSGDPRAGAGILEIATHLYPRDQGAHFNLGIAYGALGNEKEMDEYKSAIEIDPDYVPAYLNWGAAMYAKGNLDEAVDLYKKGILINPLDASLHYSLSVALEKLNRKHEAEAELILADKINPRRKSE